MSKPYTSNLINNPELTEKFNEVAYQVAKGLRTKYYSLFDYMTEDDIVSECWDKILRQDIGYDPNKNCKFESFVRMLVNNRCIDLCRKIQKHENVSSLDATYTTEDGDSSALSDFIQDDKSSEEYVLVEIQEVLNEFSSEIYSEYVCKVLSLASLEYSVNDISNILNIKSSNVRKILNSFHKVFRSKYDGTSVLLGDILLNEDFTKNENKGEIYTLLSYVECDGVKFSDVAKMIVRGYSYSKIAEKVGKEYSFVRGFIDKCLSMNI